MPTVTIAPSKDTVATTCPQAPWSALCHPSTPTPLITSPVRSQAGGGGVCEAISVFDVTEEIRFYSLSGATPSTPSTSPRPLPPSSNSLIPEASPSRPHSHHLRPRPQAPP